MASVCNLDANKFGDTLDYLSNGQFICKLGGCFYIIVWAEKDKIFIQGYFRLFFIISLVAIFFKKNITDPMSIIVNDDQTLLN